MATNMFYTSIRSVFYLYSYVQGQYEENRKKLARFFNFAFHYIDGPFTKSKFCDNVDRIELKEYYRCS